MNLSSPHLLKAILAIARVGTRQDFINWTQEDLQLCFPHGAFIGGAGRIYRSSLVPLEMLSSNFPSNYLTNAHSEKTGYRTPTIQRWLKTGEPQLFEHHNSHSDQDFTLMQTFKTSGLCNIASHGLRELTNSSATYFSFHQIPDQLGSYHIQLLEVLVPNMHAALLRVIRRSHTALVQQDFGLLSRREWQVLIWISKGKTNSEIAAILGVSFKTIKNQVQSILIKLNVNNRIQAAIKVTKSHLIDSDDQ